LSKLPLLETDHVLELSGAVEMAELSLEAVSKE
jgi:hypothetical protein